MKSKPVDLNSPKFREKIQQLAKEKGISFNAARLMLKQNKTSQQS